MQDITVFDGVVNATPAPKRTYSVIAVAANETPCLLIAESVGLHDAMTAQARFNALGFSVTAIVAFASPEFSQLPRYVFEEVFAETSIYFIEFRIVSTGEPARCNVAGFRNARQVARGLAMTSGRRTIVVPRQLAPAC